MMKGTERALRGIGRRNG